MNAPISGPMLMKKAEQLAKLPGHENFVCSNGWLDQFKEHQSTVFHKVCGEEKSVNDKFRIG